MADKAFTNEWVDLELEVSEMVADAKSIVPIDPSRLQELQEIYEDDKPQLVVLRIEGGMSKNRFNYPDGVVMDVAEQINNGELPGYFGHVSQQDRSWRFPEPQTIWLGAKTKKEKGKLALYVKGYLIPQTLAHRHVRSGLVKTASWFGKGEGKVVSGIQQIAKLTLESIDWSRPGATAMDARVVALASEMEDGENVEGLATLTLDELRKGNPALFTLMEQEVTAKVTKDLNVSEMEDEIKEGKAASSVLDKLREMFGVDPKTDILEAMTEVHEKIDNESQRTLKEKLGEILGDKLKSDKARATVMRLLPVSEMEGMTDDELKTAVNAAFDKDEQIQIIVSEMDTGRAPLTSARRTLDHRNGKVGESGMVTTSTRKL